MKVGTKVEISTNIDTEDGLFNGSLAEVYSFSMTNDNVTTVNLKFQRDDVGRKWMAENFNKSASQDPFIVNIPRKTLGFYMTKPFPKVTRTQFPLRPNSAITFNRAQGRTIPKGVVDLLPAPNAGMH